MKFEEKIAGMCLYGYIRGASKKEQELCLNKIEDKYGPGIKALVRKYLETV